MMMPTSILLEETATTVTDTTPISFNDFDLSPELRRAIGLMGYTHPTPIQEQAIPMALTGQDILGQAQTGSGKTMAFAIPSIERCNPRQKQVQTLVLCPTRELANQVASQFQALFNHLANGFQVAILVGGQPMPPQLRSLKQGAQVVVGTPGRVQDHLERGSLNLDTCTTFILDEADEMLDMGFRDDIEAILKHTVENEPQVLLFSATMSPEIKRIANSYLKSPVHINLLGEKRQAPPIEQHFMVLFPELKEEVTLRLLTVHSAQLGVVFCNTKRDVDTLVAWLKSKDIMAEGLHGDLSQVMRDKAMNAFRQGIAKVLVATDVAGRGMDVSNVGIVINYDLPRDDEDYIHRVGRTGRAGKSGIAYTFVHPREMRKLNELMRRHSVTINEAKPPMAEQLTEGCMKSLVADVRAELLQPSQEESLVRGELMEALRSEGWSMEHILNALLSQQVTRFQNKFDLELEDKLSRVGQRPPRREFGSGGGGYNRERSGGEGRGFGGGGYNRDRGGFGNRERSGGEGRSFGGGGYNRDRGERKDFGNRERSGESRGGYGGGGYNRDRGERKDFSSTPRKEYGKDRASFGGPKKFERKGS
ncbi:MAG: DEAD/DEAH box helicase [Vampirovibrionales bacterium]